MSEYQARSVAEGETLGSRERMEKPGLKGEFLIEVVYLQGEPFEGLPDGFLRHASVCQFGRHLGEIDRADGRISDDLGYLFVPGFCV